MMLAILQRTNGEIYKQGEGRREKRWRVEVDGKEERRTTL
jgi:hypothetical protein